MSDDNDEQAGDSRREGAKGMLGSYVAFLKRAVAARKILCGGILGGTLVFLALVLAVWPRTYRCESRLMATGSQALAMSREDYDDGLAGAKDLIMRHENLEMIIKQTDLVRLSREQRPFLKRIIGNLREKLRPAPTEKQRISELVGTLEDCIFVTLENGSLSIAVEWPNASTSALLVDATQNTFFETRHVAEISSIAELISILEAHASRLRNEVDNFAGQIHELRTERDKVKKANVKADAPPVKASGNFSEYRPPSAAAGALDSATTQLKTAIEAKQKAIDELEAYRARRLSEYQSRLTELKQKLTDVHPDVLDARSNIAQLSRESGQVSALRAEVKNMEADLKNRAASLDPEARAKLMARRPSGTSTTSSGANPQAASLPPEVATLLQETDDDLDPAVTAQFRYAIGGYANIRASVSAARVKLDAAQAAFKHRYQIVVPPEVPTKPAKPKVPIVFALGLFVCIALSLGTAIVLELRTDRLTETWQVQQVSLPMLAELRFPPSSTSGPPPVG